MINATPKILLPLREEGAHEAERWVLDREEVAISREGVPIGCYVHIPFCARKCAYCDFNSYSGYGADAIRRYVAAIQMEIAREGAQADRRSVDTVFFGGGTPTAIPAADEAAILAAVRAAFDVASDAEITTEANPGSSDVEGLAVLREAGFNRISFGVQSFDAGLLKTLDRVHSVDEADGALRAARAAGFDNVSLDLMYGLPNQTMTQWSSTLDRALDQGTDHLSLYALIVEDGTGFATLHRKGRLPLPSDDLTTDMFEHARERLTAAGYVQYEVSNYAKPGRESRHNLHYWRNEPYYGFGAGAVSYTDNVRRTRVLTPGRYSEAIEKDRELTLDTEVPDEAQERAETMMLGLRLTGEGVRRGAFAERFGADPAVVYAAEIERFAKLGLLEVTPISVRLTPRGVFLANEVTIAFI